MVQQVLHRADARRSTIATGGPDSAWFPWVTALETTAQALQNRLATVN
jgi:hypothetical protein